MACNKCKLVKCGCTESYLTTPPPCPDPGDCPEAQPCSEVFDAACIIYNGEDILCDTDVVITTSMSLSEAVTAMVAYFCTTSEHELAQDLICGEDTVVAAGSDLDTTLTGIVSYFCEGLDTLETQVGNNTTALLNTTQVATSCLGNPTTGCDDCTTTITFRDNDNRVIDTVQFSYTQCEGVPVTNAFGLFTQIGNSIPVTSGAGSIIGAGVPVNGLLVPADTFKIGDSYRLSVHGHVSCDPNQDINITVRSTGTSPVVLAQTGIVTLPSITDEHFEIKIDFTIRALGDLVGPAFGLIASAGQFTYTKTASGGFDGTGFSQISNLDTTVDNTLSIEAEWITGGTNSIYTELMTLTKMY